MILVTGASGNVGNATLRALLARGRQVRALSREPREWPSGVEGVVFLLSGYEGTSQLLTSLQAAGGRRVVLLSSSSAPSGDEENAVARFHIEAERLVRSSGLEWTIVQPNSFMSNATRWLPQLSVGDVVGGPVGTLPIAIVDPADVGAVAALALEAPGHAARTYRLSGPQSLTPAEQVQILGRVLGRELRFDAWPDDKARVELAKDMPEPYVEALFSFFVDGTIDETTVLPTVEQLLGRPPSTFEAWACANATRFAPG
jgi:uncharacterized protein YbjT (DUF2867 family)